MLVQCVTQPAKNEKYLFFNRIFSSGNRELLKPLLDIERSIKIFIEFHSIYTCIYVYMYIRVLLYVCIRDRNTYGTLRYCTYKVVVYNSVIMYTYLEIFVDIRMNVSMKES